MWNQFREDMGLARGTRLTAAELRFPAAGCGCIFLDCMEFTPAVSWQKMSDAQVTVHRTDFSLIPDIMKYRRAEPDLTRAVAATPREIAVIVRRLERWYPGFGSIRDAAWVRLRAERETDFIRCGVGEGMALEMTAPLYPMRTPAAIDGERTRYFVDINKRVLLPLALHWRKNANRKSLRRALAIYDRCGWWSRTHVTT